MVDVRGLQLLHYLDVHETLAAAADALYLSHSAASHRLAVLEREVGVPVTERIGRRLRLTETGRALAACAHRLHREIETTDAIIEQARTTVAGRVRIGLFQTAALRLLPVVLGDLRTAYPAVTLESTQTLALSALTSLQTGELDLAVVPAYHYRNAPPPPGLHHERLYTDRAQLVLPENHRLHRRTDPIDITELRDEEWIAGETITHLLTPWCEQAGFRPAIVHHSSEYRVMITLAGLGYGITFLPIIPNLIPTTPHVVLKRLDIPDHHQDVLLICRDTSRARPAVQAVRALILQCAQQIS
ncbi:LysR substrate-binding domain-containing protein [Nocardia miyunensis]|uniref:LysR substrate-binding domain-containing protein n=1 Tax=Nocardia miyunensis TaxID=282684 RepID=UPI00082C06DB|nr:LysR substrate-binding domain-containing protein [Nocardia miyunensis]